MSVEHYTPAEFIDAARHVMGGIDLDPASTKAVNDATVKASGIFTKDDDGFTRDWSGRVWLNPPGGKTKNKSNAALWWNKLAEEWLTGRVEQAFFLGFSIEILATSQDSARWIGEFPFCIPRRRIEFLQQDENGNFVPGTSPTHTNIIAFLPPRNGELYSTMRFAETFSKFGMIR